MIRAILQSDPDDGTDAYAAFTRSRFFDLRTTRSVNDQMVEFETQPSHTKSCVTSTIEQLHPLNWNTSFVNSIALWLSRYDSLPADRNELKDKQHCFNAILNEIIYFLLAQREWRFDRHPSAALNDERCDLFARPRTPCAQIGHPVSMRPSLCQAIMTFLQKLATASRILMSE